MNASKLIVILSIFLLSASGITAQSGSKPRPPRNLRYISENIRILEESHDEGEFDEALESIEKMQDGLVSIAGELNAAGVGGLLSGLQADLSDFASDLRQSKPDSEDFEERRIELSMALFRIMDAFSYRTPPLLDFIDRQLDELKEEVLEEGEWDGAEDELEEIEEFWEEIFENYSSVSGVDSLSEEIDDAMEELESAIKRENAGKVVSSVQELQDLIGNLSDLITG